MELALRYAVQPSARVFSCQRSTVVVQLIRNQQVMGSNPIVGSLSERHLGLVFYKSPECGDFMVPQIQSYWFRAPRISLTALHYRPLVWLSRSKRPPVETPP